MIISSRIVGSIRGAKILRRPSLVLNTIRRRPTVEFCIGCSRPVSNGSTTSSRRRRLQWSKRAVQGLSPLKLSTLSRPAVDRLVSNSYFTSHPPCHSRGNHAVSSPQKRDVDNDPQSNGEPPDDMLAYVNGYDGSTVDEHFEILQDPYMRKYAQPDGPILTVSDKKEDAEMQTIPKNQRPYHYGLKELRSAVLTLLKRQDPTNATRIYELYHALPEPRLHYLNAKFRHRLFAALALAERKDARSMMRYFAVVTDAKNTGLPLLTWEWNTALSFAARSVAWATESELEATLELWREMELSDGIKPSAVTFNILFDVAAKAGRFKIAEMVYQEMSVRGLEFNRYHHVSLMHFFGLKQNTSAMRAAYKEMVEAGEMIDTTALNCLISGFLRSGEESSAMYVYEKMKVSDKYLASAPNRSFAMRKMVSKALLMFATVGQKSPDLRLNFQKVTLRTPDLQTYRILINHYAVEVGDLLKTIQLLDDMRWYNVPVHGAIFLALFKGFERYKGRPDWTEDRLHRVWAAFIHAFDVRAKDLRISTWLAMAILDAFSRYSTRGRLLGVYEGLKSRWELDESKSQFMLNHLDKLLKHRNQERVQKQSSRSSMAGTSDF